MAAVAPTGSTRSSRRAWTDASRHDASRLEDHNELAAVVPSDPHVPSSPSSPSGRPGGGVPPLRVRAKASTVPAQSAFQSSATDVTEDDDDELLHVHGPERVTPDWNAVETNLVYSVSLCPTDQDDASRVQTPGQRVSTAPSRPKTPRWNVGRMSSLFSVNAVHDLSDVDHHEGMKDRALLLRQRGIRAVAHLTALLALGTADLLFFLEHNWIDGSRDETLALTVVLGVIYLGLVVWLVACFALPATWELSGLGIVQLPKTWLMLALTHTSMAFVSSYWRETLSTKHGEPGQHAAAIASMLQLLVTVLYPADPVVSAILAFLSIAGLVVVEVSMGDAPLEVIDNALTLTCAGVICVVAASWQYWADRSFAMKSQLRNCLIEDVFLPLSSKSGEGEKPASDIGSVTTHLGQLTKKLKECKEKCEGSALEDDLKSLFGDVLGFLLEELTDMNFDRMSVRDLDELPPMMAEYVQKTLGQGGNRTDNVLAKAEDIQRSLDATLLNRPTSDEDDEKEPVTEVVAKQSKLGQDVLVPLPPRPVTVVEIQPKDACPTLDSLVDDLANLTRITEDKDETPPHLVQKESSLVLLSSDERISGGTEASSAQQWQASAPSTSATPGSFEENIDVMAAALKQGDRDVLPWPKLADELQKVMQKKLGLWHFDIFKLAGLVGGRPLIIVGGVALAQPVSRLQIEASRVRNFLSNIEARYNSNPYHNSIHGADVMNNMLYFLRLQDTALVKLEPIEHLAALVAAAAHDVGHTGFANGFQVTAQTALAQLYNDQSPLENMHCTIAFAAMRAASCNFLADLEAPMRATFRNYVTQMILETDLTKHIATLTRFRQELLRGGFDASHQHNFAQRKELATFALKCSDVAHSTKHFDLHVNWTLRINAEFFHQGDAERDKGMACSPFCDRTNINVAESQRGFYSFIVCPLFQAMDEHLGGRIQHEVLRQMDRNLQFWKRYDGSGFNYEDPTSNATMLRSQFMSWFPEVGGSQGRQPVIARRQSWNLMPLPSEGSDYNSNTGGVQASIGLSSTRKSKRSQSANLSSPRTSGDKSLLSEASLKKLATSSKASLRRVSDGSVEGSSAVAQIRALVAVPAQGAATDANRGPGSGGNSFTPQRGPPLAATA